MEQPDLFSTSLRSLSEKSGCNHLMEPTKIEQSNIFCSAWKSAIRYESKLRPDFGLYADYHWKTNSRNEFIDWPDFGIPTYPNLAFKQIVGAFELGKQMNVEIGCIGGHGRTGTILSCMFIMDRSCSASEAIYLARTTYCPVAVETSRQEQFVELFGEMFYEL